MVTASINVDVAYTSNATELEWRLEDGNGNTVAEGKSERRPDQTGVTIYPNRILEDLLESTLPTSEGVSLDQNAGRQFVLKDGQGNTLETYWFVNSSEPLSGEILSDPVNGHADPRQLVYLTRFDTTAGDLDIG